MSETRKSQLEELAETLPGVAKIAEFESVTVDGPEHNEKGHHSLFENMLEGYAHCKMLYDDNGRPEDWVYLEVNPAFERLTGLKNAAGKRATDAIPGIKADHPELFEIYGRVASTGKPEKFETYFKPLGINLNVSAFRPAKGHFVAVFENITGRKRAEESLLRSELNFRSIFENSMDGVLLTVPDGRILMANPAACTILGRTEQEICESGRDGLIDSTDPRLPQLLQSRKHEGKIKCELNFKHKDGTCIPVELTSVIFNYNSGEERSVIVLRDITDRKKSEEALTDSEQRFRKVFEQGPMGMGILDLDYRWVAVNEKLCEITGFTSGELAKLSFIDITHPEDIKKDVSKVEFLVRGAIPCYQIEKRCIRKNKEIIWIKMWGAIVRNEQGEPGYFLAMIQDITSARKFEQERQLLQAQLFQSQKMESLGTLVGGIAHDFNNMLQIMIGYSELLLNGEENGDQKYNDLRAIIRTGEEGAELVRKLLAFGQQGQVVPVKLDLNGQIRQLSTLISRTLPHVVRVDLDLTDKPTTIRAGKSQIDQVVMNLAINSSEAMPNGGELNIATKIVFLDDDYCKSHLEAKPGAYVMLTCHDSGRGMDTETLSKIFDPFFSTKERGSTRGTGLGLSVVRGIVQQNGGHLTCQSEPGKGTQFKVYFPAVEAPAVTKEAVAPTVQFGVKKTIMIVEDNRSVAELERRGLVKAGHKVIVATNAREALDIYQKRKDEISLVILDLLMPEMSGKDCLMEMRKIKPTIKMLIASGYAPEDELQKEINPLVQGFLIKPFGISDLVNKVRLVLGGE
ncbi:MAG: PAS domain S-box protein [Deltaproteobacteria bacterium]|nr:PAS domain S-box protein [Deltaproteobacteria bacterium]